MTARTHTHATTRSHQRRSAFTLIEVIIALFVIALTSTAATSLILQTNRSQNEEVHRIQAHLLIDEVTNVVTMIRNSNWIRFADDTCWLVPLTKKDCENPPEEIIGKNYLLAQDPNDLHWELIAGKNDALDLKNNSVNNDQYALYQNNTSSSFSYKLLYTPRPGTAKPANAQPEYYRMVTIEKGCTMGGGNQTDISSDISRAITIIANVQWRIGSKPYGITERTCIFNDRAS